MVDKTMGEKNVRIEENGVPSPTRGRGMRLEKGSSFLLGNTRRKEKVLASGKRGG